MFVSSDGGCDLTPAALRIDCRSQWEKKPLRPVSKEPAPARSPAAAPKDKHVLSTLFKIGNRPSSSQERNHSLPAVGGPSRRASSAGASQPRRPSTASSSRNKDVIVCLLP